MLKIPWNQITFMNTLLYTTHSWRVGNSKSIFQHIDFIPGHIDVLTNHKSLKFSFDNSKAFGMIGNEIFDDYMATYRTSKTWREYYDKIDVSQYKDYDNIYVIAPPTYCLYGLTDEKLEKLYAKWENLLDSNRELHFNSHALPLLHMMILAKASREFHIPFFQHNFEVTGIDFSKIKGLEPYQYVMFHGYKYRNLDYYTTLQNYYLKYVSPIYKKTLDFAFCFYTFEKQNQKHRLTATNELKEKLIPKLDRNKMFFYEYIKENKDMKPILRDEYFDKLKKARFTYIIPSFQTDVFSIDRFIDALAYDCLPLIHPLVVTEDVEKTYDVDLSALKTFDLHSEEKRLELLNYLKQKIMYVSRLPKLRS